MNPIVAKEKEDMYQVTKPRRDNFCPAFLEIKTFCTGTRVSTRVSLRSKLFAQAQGFDEYISEHLVSLNRSLPDRRDDWCKNNVLVDPAYLPSTSVIFIPIPVHSF